MGTYKADSHKTDTFFVYFFPVKRTQGRIKNKSHARSTLFLGLFSTLSVTFFTPFSSQSITFSDPKNLYWTGISSLYPAPWLIRFQVTLHLMAQLGRVRKSLKILLKFFGTSSPPGKYMFLEYSWNIPTICSQIMSWEYWILEYSLNVLWISYECCMFFLGGSRNTIVVFSCG